MATTLRITNRSIVRAVLIAGAFGVVATVVARASGTVGWFVEAAVFAALAWPLVQRLGRHMPKFVAVLVLTALVAGVATLLATTGLMELQAESARFRESVPEAVRNLEQTEGIGTIVKDLRLADDIEQFADEISDRLRFKHADVPGLATKVGGSASAVLVVWILAVMLVFTGPAMVESALGQVAASRQDAVREVLRRAYGRSVRYLGLMVVRSIVLGALTFTISASIGLDMPGLLAVVAALMSFVPYVGIIGGALPLALMAHLIIDHYRAMLDHYGSDVGLRCARKHIGWYTKGLTGSAEFRNFVNRIDDPEQVITELTRFYEPFLTQAAA